MPHLLTHSNHRVIGQRSPSPSSSLAVSAGGPRGSRTARSGAGLLARRIVPRVLAAFLAMSVVGGALMTTTAAVAQDENKKKFRFGDPMPELDGKWAGDLRPEFSDGKAYIVLFIGAQAQPSRRAILQLGDVRNRYVGQIDLVLFTKEKVEDGKMLTLNRGMKWERTPVGHDGESKKTWDGWMKATNQPSELALFVVDKHKRLVWGGDPGDIDLIRVLDLVLADKFDPISEERATPAIAAARRAGKIRNYSEAYMHYDSAIAVNPALFSNIALEKYKFMVTEAQDRKAGEAFGRSLLVSYADNPAALVDLAVLITTDPDIKERDKALAEDAVKRVYALASPAPRPTDPSVLARLATFQFASGRAKEAVELQMEAWMIAPETSKPAYKTKLDQYRNAAKKEGNNEAAGERKSESANSSGG